MLTIQQNSQDEYLQPVPVSLKSLAFQIQWVSKLTYVGEAECFIWAPGQPITLVMALHQNSIVGGCAVQYVTRWVAISRVMGTLARVVDHACLGHHYV